MPFCLSPASEAVKGFISKMAVLDPIGPFDDKGLNGLTGLLGQKRRFLKKPF